MTPEEQQKRTELEQQINAEFSQLQQDLGDLKKNIQLETDETKKEEQNKKIKEMEAELSEINVGKERLERLTSLQEQELLSLKTRLESLKNAIQSFKGEVVDLQEEIRESADKQNEKSATPTTYELLKDSETYNRLLNIISSNPSKFKKLKKDEEGNELDTPEKKLEYIFRKIRESIVQFMENKLGKSEITKKVIDNTIAPAFERSLMELLRENGNETNVSMLKRIDNISFDSFKKLLSGVGNFAKKATGSYTKFSQWINAIDYLSVHNGVLREPNHSKVLTSPLEFQKYMNNEVFAPKDEKGDIVAFSPYSKIEGNIFQIDNDQTFEFGISRKKRRDQLQGQKSEEEKSDEEIILERIGNIQVVNNPRTTSLIVEMLNKPAEFFKATSGLQETANGLLDGIDSLNSATKMFGVDILGEITKIPEKRGFLFKIMDFVCKLIGITGGLEGIVKKWRMDKMNLTNEKNDNISKIFEQYKDNAGENKPLNITDENSYKTALNDFAVTDPEKSSTTKGDFLRDSMVKNMDISLVSPAVVQQILGDSYLKKETTEKGETKISINEPEKVTDADKLKLAQGHLTLMKSHLENYKDNDLSDFYTNIHSTEDLALCITASLYADKEDVIEGVKAKVFLPENYGAVRSDGTIENSNSSSMAISELSSAEKTEMQNLVEQSKTPNTINYLNNPTYKKYLNVIERDLNLPRYALECVCKQESGGNLYRGNNLLGSSAGAKGLFQFMPGTADEYIKNGQFTSQLAKKYGKTFTTRDEFLKDPLATAWAAGIKYSEYMHKYNYNFQSSLACYNRGIGNYQEKVGNKNLSSGDLAKLPAETKGYVEKISKDVLEHNSDSSNDVLLADLGKYSWNNGKPENG